MNKRFILFGAIFAALGVALGAFGAHGLEEFLTKTQRADVFETAVRYQLYHAFALLFVGILADRIKSNLLKYAGYLFTAGILLFSGSLYLLVGTQITRFGMITPLGGLAFIVGWGLLAAGALRD
ncbi:MAG: DUF423 domain-containing protein [Bacteroidia bacterium]|nr:DUF423 domain-containing protein [Bacteroidia bacterium]